MTLKEKEENLVLKYIKQIAKEQGTDYIQSWWLNKRNCPELWMDTPKINTICKRLVKAGVIIIDKNQTSTSTGTCYKII